MSDNVYWLAGEFSLNDVEKKREMNDLILEILRKTGTGRLTTKMVDGKRITVVSKAKPNKKGIVNFDYSIYEKKKRKGNYYDTVTCKLVTPDRDYNHFGLTMNLIMVVLEAYSETPYFFMHEDKLGGVDVLATIVEELTGIVLNFERRSKAFDTLAYLKQFDEYKNITYSYEAFPFGYYNSDGGQFVFTVVDLDRSFETVEGVDALSPQQEKIFLCQKILKRKPELKEEAFVYISMLMDMTLEERKEEAKRKHALDFIGRVAEYLPGAYLVKIYAEAFHQDFWKTWYQIGKKGYWDVVDMLELKSNAKHASKIHLLYEFYRMENEDDFIGLWAGDEVILSETMQKQLSEYKNNYAAIDDALVADYDTIWNLMCCIEDLQSIWNMDKYIDKDFLEEFIAHKDDIRYKKATFVLKELIDEEMEMFSEFTEQQIRKWILQKVNWKVFAKKYWHYVDILSNKEWRGKLLGF